MYFIDKFIVLLFLSGILTWFFVPVKNNNNFLTNKVFYGSKISDNFYKFNMLDYHSFLIFKKPFGLLFCSNSIECEKVEQLIRATQSSIIIFEINSSELQQDLYKNIAKNYRVDSTRVLLILDKDSNVTGRINEIKTSDEIKNLIH